MDDLPLDIFINILSRVPVKSLIRLRSVSKLWCHAIDHPFLVAARASRDSDIKEPNMMLAISHPTPRQKTLSINLVRERRRSLKATVSPIAKLDSVSHCTLMGSCNGLLCFSLDKGKQCLVLSNPLRGTFFLLPKATIFEDRKEFVSCGLGYDSSTNTYKVIRVVCQKFGFGSPRVEAHRVGTNSWKELDETPPYPVCGKAVFAHGFLHWLVRPFVGQLEGTNLIVSFDTEGERFHSTPHPMFLPMNAELLFQLLDVKGNLGMADLSDDRDIKIWVVRDWGKREWARAYSIGIRAPEGRFNNGNVEVIGVWENGEILMKCDEGFFIYSVESGLRYSQSLGLESDSTLLCSHHGSLISLSNLTQVC